jgi:excisionase family DNA binding protein
MRQLSITRRANMFNIASQTWWTRRDAAAYARVSEATIGREARSGRLRHARAGGRRALRFKREWIDEWLSSGLPSEVQLAASHCTESNSVTPHKWSRAR